MTDPHISSFENNDFYYNEQNGYDTMGFDGIGMEERMLERKAQRMYESLAAKGQYAQIDKAKHNKNYRNYLLQNFDEDFF